MKKRTIFTPNEIIDYGDYYEICLYNNKCKEVARTKIDKDDLNKVKQYKWHFTAGYAKFKKDNKLYFIHNLLLPKKNEIGRASCRERV